MLLAVLSTLFKHLENKYKTERDLQQAIMEKIEKYNHTIRKLRQEIQAKKS